MSARQHPVTVAIDLGGTSIRIGVYSDQQELLTSLAMPTRVSAGPQAVVHEMAEGVSALLARLAGENDPCEPLGLGIGSPGPINLETGVLGLLPNFPGWDNFPIRASLEEATGLPVYLECDANAAAIAEWRLGAGKSTGIESMAMFTLGTGVGTGVILDGKIWHGMFGMGGEVGHSTVDPNGPLCGCGSYGCLEVFASATGLHRLARDFAAASDATNSLRRLVTREEGFTAHDVALLADAGDLAARRAFERVGYYLGLGVANLTNMLDLPMIVIGGGLAASWHLFAPAMFAAVRRYSVVYRLAEPTQLDRLEHHRTYIRPASLGSSAGLLGAGLLPLMHARARRAVGSSV